MNQASEPAPAGKYAERIAKGAALLDEKAPGWRQRIDLEALDISFPTACVVGQATGRYFATIEEWFGDGEEAQALAHGFEWEPAGDGSVLTGEWRQYIEATR